MFSHGPYKVTIPEISTNKKFNSNLSFFLTEQSLKVRLVIYLSFIINFNFVLQLQVAHVTKLVQRKEINVPINLQENVDVNLLSQVSIVMNVLMVIGELD